MIDTRLIFLDGLPGTGSSTQGKWLETQLQAAGYKAKWYHEFDSENPVLWLIEREVSLDAVKRALAPEKFEETFQHSLRLWEEFIERTKDDDSIYLFENIPFQNTIAVFLQHDISRERLEKYARDLYQRIEASRPAVLYFYPQNVRQALLRICETRGKDFENELTVNMENLAFLRNRNLNGLDGITVLWQETLELMNSLYAELDFRRLSIEISEQNWSEYRKQITEFLELS